MTLELRPYQREALDALYGYWDSGGGNGLIVLPTGAGKSLVIATLVRELLDAFPDLRIGMLTHVKELIGQNAQELLRVWPAAPVGIYSAGLGRRDLQARILFMGIQSAYKKAATLGGFDVLLIDECHLIGRTADSMYGRFLADCRSLVPDMRIVGLTATPYRLDSGRLDQGGDAMFDDVVYESDVADLIEQGFLSPLVSKATVAEISTAGVSVRGGEFVAGELEAAASLPEVVAGSVREVVALGADRAGWLAFCTGVDHAALVRDEFRRHGVSCEMVTGDTPAGERDSIIGRFKARQIRCLTSVGVLTTGFNAPHVDLIAMLRPTLSTGLYVQMVGRGFRLAEGKSDCLILDFAGNVRRHGPVDAVRAGRNGKPQARDENRVKPDTVRAKACPACQTLAPLDVFSCLNPACDHEWPKPQPKHQARADDEAAILKREQAKLAPKWIEVTSTAYSRHVKRNDPSAPPTLKVTYTCGMLEHSEWLCIEHAVGSFPRQKAMDAWRKLGGANPVPRTVDEALGRIDELQEVYEIATRPDGSFTRVVDRKTRPKAARPPRERRWWEVLGLDQGASRLDVDRAYRELAKSVHPDFGGSTEEMQALNRARDEAHDELELYQ